MASSERDVRVEERANRILRDERAATAHATFVEAQLRHPRMRNLLAGLRELARIRSRARGPRRAHGRDGAMGQQ